MSHTASAFTGDRQRPVASTRPDARWRTWVRGAVVVAIVAVLAALGIANVVLRARYHEVEDGVLWGSRPEGVVAVDVAGDSPAALSGITAGDVLLAVNGVPVESPADVIEFQHRGTEGTTLTYSIVRLGSRQAFELALAPAVRHSSMYFVLAGVGLFTLFVGASVRLRRPRDPATLHFFWLCVAFFGAFTFSFNGPFDRLDWVFYWGDAVAMALLPPLLLHFTLVFPERPNSRGSMLSSRIGLTALYLPALLLGALRIAAVARGVGQGGPWLMAVLDLLDRLEPVYLFVCGGAAVAVLVRGFEAISSVTARRQLRWIAWGSVLGVGPYALFYALPWAFGANPPLALQLTAIPLGLVPLAFASAIVRYRLRDVEVIIKRGLAYTAFLAASGLLYLAMQRAAGALFGDENDPHNWVVALLATLVVVLLAQPVKEAVQNALDRVFYRDRYDYRRALVGFARDLNSDLDVVRLSQRLVSRVVETLVLDQMSLLLADERRGDFESIGDFGFQQSVPRLPRTSSFVPRLDLGRTIALDDPLAAARFSAEEVEFWRDRGIFYFVPCVFEEVAIAVLALGRKESGEPFNSEDLALLNAVAGQVATAIENGRLYRQLHLKAEEIGRMREFNENILESLDDGLAVFDDDEVVVRWNQALVHMYGLSRNEAVGHRLAEIFDGPFVEAVRAARHENPLGTTLFKVPLHPHPDGDGAVHSLMVNATIVPLQSHNADLEIAGTILLIENVTERVRLEEQLQISEKMASIGLLAAGVAHEVNTPLTGISSYTQMLLENADPADPRTPILEKIERQTFRAAKIVNGLLTLSRPGTPGGERAPVDLNAVVNDVYSLLEHQFEAGRIKVRRDLHPDPVVVLAIEHQMQQVFLNLFLNARDAMPKGGWLTVTTKVEHGNASAVVADTGSGIPPEQLARIYDPFFTTKAIGRGTGLGLSISYGIIREHDGTIRCDSAVGQGTRFAVTLPLAAASQPLLRSTAGH